MGCGNSRGPPAQTPRNTLNVVCLGLGGCGKTTFVKQMKIIHDIGWQDIELQSYKKIIRANLIVGLQGCLTVLTSRSKTVQPQNEAVANAVQGMSARTADFTDDNVKTTLKALWSDPGVQEVARVCPEQLETGQVAYFLDDIDRVLAPDFIPTNDDILRCRQRTAGASTVTVYFQKKYFEFFDIGGQKPERNKWATVLAENDIAAIIYFVAADEYDVADEDRDHNLTKLELSRSIFSEILEEKLPDGLPLLLFLNKTDRLKERLKDSSGVQEFKKYFPKFEGSSADAALTFLGKLFVAGKQSVEVRHTCALDTKAMSELWDTISQAVLDQSLSALGM